MVLRLVKVNMKGERRGAEARLGSRPRGEMEAVLFTRAQRVYIPGITFCSQYVEMRCPRVLLSLIVMARALPQICD